MASPALAPTRSENPLLANLKKKEIPSLYGLRGIAALTVVLGHYSYGTPVARWFPAGYAVSLFFILSGLLITWLALKEIDRTGSLHLKKFYARRALRLFPAFYAVWLCCVFVLKPFPEKWATFFYMGDYYLALTGAYGPLTIAWSLGVEEKFYLLWPWLLRKTKRLTLIRAVCAAIVLDQIYRAVLQMNGYGIYSAFSFDTNLDCILLGCLIALLAHQGVQFPRWFGSPLIPVIAIPGIYLFSESIVHYLLALLLIWAVIQQPWALNNPIADFLGRISYSLYLCHVLALWRIGNPLIDPLHLPHWSFSIGLKVAIALTGASALHFGIERPFLTLKDRFHARHAH